MTAVILDLSTETAFERYASAQRAFMARPSVHLGEVYRQRAHRFWLAFNRSSVGWDVELEFLDRKIARTIQLHEMRERAR